MALVNGKDVVLFFAFPQVLGEQTVYDYKPIACARQISFEVTRDIIETSVTGTGQWKSYTSGAISYTGSIEGLVFLKEASNVEDPRVALTTIYSYIQAGVVFQLRYFEKDNENNVLIKNCNVILTSINEISSFDNVSTFTANFVGVGEPDFESFNAGMFILDENYNYLLTESEQSLLT